MSLLRGTLVWLNILGQASSPDEALDHLNDFGEAVGAMPLAMTYDRQPDNQVMGVFRSCFQGSGVPSSQDVAQGSVVYAVFFGMRPLRRMYEWQFNGQPLTPALVSDLWDYSLAAHSLNAPEPIATLITTRTDGKPLGDVKTKEDFVELLDGVLAADKQADAARAEERVSVGADSSGRRRGKH